MMTKIEIHEVNGYDDRDGNVGVNGYDDRDGHIGSGWL